MFLEILKYKNKLKTEQSKLKTVQNIKQKKIKKQEKQIEELIKNQIHPITGWEYRKERDKAIMLKQQRRREKRKK